MTRAAVSWSLALAVVLSACSSGHTGTHSSTTRATATTAAQSLTPLVTTGAAAGRLTVALLTTADFRAISGAPTDLRAVPANNASLFADPDPRSPCGKRLAQPDFAAGAGVGIQSTGLGGFEFVIPETVGRATAYVSAVASETRPGCAAYQTKTNTGGQQTVTLLTTVALAKVADQQTAALLKITNQGRTVYAFEAALRVGALLAVEVLLAVSPPAPTFLRAVTARAAARLKTAPGR
jgi:hypothetical protein